MAAATHVAVIELPPQSLTTAQIRFPRSADLSDQDRFPHWREAIVRANQSLTTTDRDHQRATMVRAACVTATARQQAMNWNNRPLCLVDELVPWLLWQISRCSYPLMQLVGGIAAQVLQPGNHWQQGVLRLLPTLHLQTPTIEHRFDLATGQSLRLGQGVLPGDAICQQSAEIGWLLQTQPIAWLQSPVQVQWLLQQVQQTALTLPEMACLQAGIAVDWSEASPNWQAATLSLTLDFTFLSETTYDGDDRPW